MYSISSFVWVAITVNLNLLISLGTDGGLMDDTKIPSFSSFLENLFAKSAGPMMIGMIGVSPSTTFNPESLRSFLIRPVFSFKLDKYSSLFSFNKFKAAFALAIVAGESAVENMKGLDLFIR